LLLLGPVYYKSLHN